MNIGFSTGIGSSFFQGLSGGSSLGNLNYLSDYAMLKNGSYGKLLKAYYGTTGSRSTSASETKTSSGSVLDRILEEKKHPVVSKETQEANEKLTTLIPGMKSAVSALQNDKTYTDADGVSASTKVAAAMKDYVAQYNELVSTAKNSTLLNKTAHVAGMMQVTASRADQLAQIGVTVNGDGTLQLDEAALKQVDTAKVQELFAGDNVISYGATVLSRLNFAGVSGGAAERTEQKETQERPAYEGAAALKKDIETLTSSALYEKKTGADGTAQADVEKILDAVKSFAGNYNAMLDSASRSYNSGVLSNLSSILEKTERNKDALAQLGIRVDAKGKMTVDEETFRKADMDEVQKLFEEYGASLAVHVSLVQYYETTQAGAASGYTANGTYSAQGSLRYDAAV